MAKRKRKKIATPRKGSAGAKARGSRAKARASSAARASAGGAAVGGGVRLQHRVGAWLEARVLAEADAAPLWDLPAGTVLEYVRYETGQDVDDLLTGTADDRIVRLQVKRSLDLSESSTSDLASAVEQCVRQFFAYRRAPGTLPWERPLQAGLDRLLIVTLPASSKAVTVDLREVLRKFREDGALTTLRHAAANDRERRAASVFMNHVKRMWRAQHGSVPSPSELREFLPFIYIESLDPEPGQTEEREARDTLSRSVVRKSADAGKAWKLLIDVCANRARSGANRAALQDELLKEQIDLQGVRSFREDIARLRERSTRMLKQLEDFAQIVLPDATAPLRINRPWADQLILAMRQGSLLLTGEPGVGKTGTQHDAARKLVTAGEDVIVLLAADLTSNAVSSSGSRLPGIEHDLETILENWPGVSPGFIFVDAIDAVRDESAALLLRTSLGRILRSGSRWRVAASVRIFDARYDPQLQAMFPGAALAAGHPTPELNTVRHLHVGRLSEAELAQAKQRSKGLEGLIDTAPAALLMLLREPFNLRLAADLLRGGTKAADLTPVRTQVELLDRYWQARVRLPSGKAVARELAIKRLCDQMIRYRSTRANVLGTLAAEDAEAVNDLLSAHVLVDVRLHPNAPANPRLLQFSHHLLYDYAIAVLVLAGDGRSIAEQLAADPQMVLGMRPSLEFYFQAQWLRDPTRAEFWRQAGEVAARKDVAEIAKVIAPSVAAALCTEPNEFRALLEALATPEQAEAS